MKKTISIFLILALSVTLFAGCQGGKAPAAAPETTKPAETVDLSDPEDLGMTDFDSRLIEFLRQTGLKDKSFTVSPLSFKAALALAAEGAEGETLDQLLSVLGFSDLKEMEAWYQTVLVGVDRFEEYFADPWNRTDGTAYQVVNSVWQNQNMSGEFLEEYANRVSELLRSEVHTETAEAITAAINNWVKEKTNGLIPSIVNDVSDSAAVLVNALYLKTAWVSKFHESEQTGFTTASGQNVQKEFMEQREQLRYYEDENCQLVVLPLQGGMNMVLVLGEDAGFAGKLQKAETELVQVIVPKFEVESTFDHSELCNYLRNSGCSKALTDDAEFAKMFTAPICVDDIIQKAKVKADEDGLEAAAATAIIMKNTSIGPMNPVEPKIFLADRPFSFYILQGEESPELLFWGQIMD